MASGIRSHGVRLAPTVKTKLFILALTLAACGDDTSPGMVDTTGTGSDTGTTAEDSATSMGPDTGSATGSDVVCPIPPQGDCAYWLGTCYCDQGFGLEPSDPGLDPFGQCVCGDQVIAGSNCNPQPCEINMDGLCDCPGLGEIGEPVWAGDDGCRCGHLPVRPVNLDPMSNNCYCGQDVGLPIEPCCVWDSVAGCQCATMEIPPQTNENGDCVCGVEVIADGFCA